MSNTANSDPGTPRACRLGRNRRMTASRLFWETRRQQRRFAGRYLVICLRAAPDAQLRLGVVTGRNIGGAVIRSRARRRLRELFRRQRRRMRGNYDVVMLARRGIDRAAWHELEIDFLQAARRAGLLP